MRPALAWTGVRGLAAYYLASPLFLVLDLALAAPVRVAGVDGLGGRLAYYGGGFLLGLACRRWPAAAPYMAMAESGGNLLLLMLAVLLPVWSAPDVVLAGGEPDTGLILARTVNLALAGGVLVWAFHAHGRRARQGAGGLSRR